MDRRDFLLFRAEGRARTAELSCERLYMHYAAAQAAADPPAAADDESGEPPARWAARSPRQLFDDLAGELQDVAVLRVTETEWLAREDFRREVERLVATCRARGQRVELA